MLKIQTSSIILCMFFLINISCAQIKLPSSFPKFPSGQGLSNADIIKGLKEALSIGSRNAGNKASQTDGFYGNSIIRIPFPSEAEKMKSTLIQMGMQSQVNAFEKQLNRAAEDAANKAATIFLDAITSMNINDGLTILRGKDDEATQYLKNNTSTKLKSAFTPVVNESLQKVEITKYWTPLITTYNKLPFVQKMNPDLNAYVTERAISGLFVLVAQEETKIRKDPAARVTDILKRVFGKA